MLRALKSHMLTPELVAHFIKTFEAEVTRHQRESGATMARPNAQLASVERRLEGVLRAIENGAWNDSVKQRLNALEAEKRQLQAQRASAETSDNTVRLHPNAAALYAAKVADLQAALNDAAIRAEAAESLGSLIEKVVLTPDDSAPDGLAAELHGDLAMILNLATTPAVKQTESADIVPIVLPSIARGHTGKAFTLDVRDRHLRRRPRTFCRVNAIPKSAVPKIRKLEGSGTGVVELSMTAVEAIFPVCPFGPITSAEK